jgi:SAM-dependent methyltransferase
MKNLPRSEQRTPEQILQHYNVERELADRLRAASQPERSRLYGLVYEELWRRVPTHPSLTRVRDPKLLKQIAAEKIALLRGYLHPEDVFLEVGAGDCRLSMEVAGRVKKAYAVDVCDQIGSTIPRPPNFELLLSNGTDIPVADESITIAYSYQLMEHLHPDDAHESLCNIWRALAPGGLYICITPNRLCGPHDVSKYFDPLATGFHLKEYTITDVMKAFVQAGLQPVHACPGLKGRFWRAQLTPIVFLEKVVGKMPWRARVNIGGLPLMRNVLMAAIVGQKGGSA